MSLASHKNAAKLARGIAFSDADPTQTVNVFKRWLLDPKTVRRSWPGAQIRAPLHNRCDRSLTVYLLRIMCYTDASQLMNTFTQEETVFATALRLAPAQLQQRLSRLSEVGK